jgi:ABC-2 type transport system ATP-binding protein
MRRRLGLAEVLIKKPEIAILDEPTQGLDPESASEFLELIAFLKKEENITILLSSHLLNQVQSVCDRVGLFFKGKMVISGTVAELSSRILGGKFAITVQAEGENIPEQLSRLPGVNSLQSCGDACYTIESEKDIRPELAEAIGKAKGKLYELSMHRHSLDAIYKAYFKEAVNAT